MNPKDYTLEEWIKLWQEAHESDSEETYTYPEYLKKFAPSEYEKLPSILPELPFTISVPAPIPFNPTNPYREWWRKSYTEPSITTDHT